ncbi:MAG: AAA family ATPase [Candidatus Riflebacteria bacterium]|nr:AAA family ATPase [Candidatus Riflebacteria bacterium]
MRSFIDRERLFDRLKVDGQKRQIMICGGEDDDFMVDYVTGTVDICKAITLYLLEKKYDQILILDRSRFTTKLDFPNSEMEQNYKNINQPRVSRDPKAGNNVTFIDDDDDDEEENNAQQSTANEQNNQNAQQSDNATNQRVQQATEQAASAGVGEEENLLGSINRAIEEHPDQTFAIVYMYPDTMLLDANYESEHINKVRIISGLARLRNCDSYLILDSKRESKFIEFLDWVLNNDEYSQRVYLQKPKRNVFEAFIKRAMCRNNFYCRDLDVMSSTIAAEGGSLRNFEVRLQKFMKTATDFPYLDDIYKDNEKVRNLDDILNSINNLVGLNEIKTYANELVLTKQENDENNSNSRISLPNMIFTGAAGTGKTTVAKLLGQLFLNLGLRTRNAFVEVSISDFAVGRTPSADTMNMKINEADGGILCIDEPYLLCDSEDGKQALQVLIKRLEERGDNFSVILTGYSDKFAQLFKINQGFKTRFAKTINFRDYTEEQLFDIVVAQTDKESLVLSSEAETKIIEYIASYSRRGGMANGHGANQLFSKILANFEKRKSLERTVIGDDIPEAMRFHEKEAKEFIETLDQKFVGLPKVKDFLRTMYKKQLAANKRKAKDKPAPNNCMFLGNPGTGKTTVARLTGQLFYYLGLVSEKNKLIETDPIMDFTSSYVGEYAQKVRDKFDEALGGVLFIDEAYQLANDEQGRKVVDQMVKLMTEPKYLNLIVIMAGYPDEMRKLYDANPGLKRRCPNEVFFDDFNNEELKEIFMQQMKDDGLSQDGDPRSFDSHLKSELARMAAQRHFGNAGAVINYYKDFVLGNQAERLNDDPEADNTKITVSDLTGSQKDNKKPISEILADLDKNFIGLKSLKEAIKKMSNRIRLEQVRSTKLGVPPSSGGFNIRFVGNPGTGKTTIARYIADIFCSLGIITRPKIREYRGVDLKGSYVGQTKDKVNKLFEDSQDSVVLIDEIYSLYQKNANNQDSFALEAIDALVGAMTDPKNATTIIIIAGYKDRMDEFLEGNAGLASRFPLEIEFPDYSDSECVEIVRRQLAKKKFVIPDQKKFNDILSKYFSVVRKQMGSNFGNARTAGSVVSYIEDSVSSRLSEINEEDLTEEVLTTIDVDMDLPSASSNGGF